MILARLPKNTLSKSLRPDGIFNRSGLRSSSVLLLGRSWSSLRTLTGSVARYSGCLYIVVTVY